MAQYNDQASYPVKAAPTGADTTLGVDEASAGREVVTFLNSGILAIHTDAIDHTPIPTTDQKAGLDAAATPITAINPVATEATTDALDGRVSTNETNIGLNTTDISTNKTDITALQGTAPTANQKAALDAANAPAAGNAFATVADIPAPGGANLGIGSRTTTTLDVTSDSGTDATVPAATTSLAGLLTSTDKTKLDANTVPFTGAASDTTTGTFANARISEASVTQHEGALTLTESQISDLGPYAPATTSRTEAGSWTMQAGDLGAPGSVIVLSTGATPTLTINTGLGAFVGDTAYVVRNGTGDMAISGTATLVIQTGGTAAGTAIGMITISCVATDTYVIAGSLVAA